MKILVVLVLVLVVDRLTKWMLSDTTAPSARLLDKEGKEFFN